LAQALILLAASAFQHKNQEIEGLESVSGISVAQLFAVAPDSEQPESLQVVV